MILSSCAVNAERKSESRVKFLRNCLEDVETLLCREFVRRREVDVVVISGPWDQDDITCRVVSSVHDFEVDRSVSRAIAATANIFEHWCASSLDHDRRFSTLKPDPAKNLTAKHH